MQARFDQKVKTRPHRRRRLCGSSSFCRSDRGRPRGGQQSPAPCGRRWKQPHRRQQRRRRGQRCRWFRCRRRGLRAAPFLGWLRGQGTPQKNGLEKEQHLWQRGRGTRREEKGVVVIAPASAVVFAAAVVAAVVVVCDRFTPPHTGTCSPWRTVPQVDGLSRAARVQEHNSATQGPGRRQSRHRRRRHVLPSSPTPPDDGMARKVFARAWAVAGLTRSAQRVRTGRRLRSPSVPR